MTPLQAFSAFYEPGENSVLFETEEFSFLGFHPKDTFQVKGGPMDMEGLRSFLRGRTAVGYFTYDAIRLFERIPDRHEDGDGIPDIFFQVYETQIIFDHRSGEVSISAKDADKVREVCVRDEEMKVGEEVVVEPGDEEFCEMVERAKEYIRQGDAFQVVLSRTFSKSFSGSAFSLYQRLKRVAPAPFMFFMQGDGYEIVGASPERLIRVQDGVVETMPIAGTFPLDASEEDLLRDEKEGAEHMMLVDLGRNDLGRVCVPGSVKVKELKKVKRFSHVMHLVSVVEGKLKEGCDALDALQAAFPAGTLSGAPKIRAMEIIDELEKSRRGLYGGAICMIDDLGNLESCIAIRTAFIKDGKVRLRTGAGIVCDSEAVKEADETRHKAKALLEVLK